jgi:lysophospholipase L1-like esterase
MKTMTKKCAFTLALIGAVCLVGSSVFAAATAPKRRARKVGPVKKPITDTPGLPRVLLIGDSISIGYTLDTRAMLKGKVNLHRIPANGGPTTRGLAELDNWLGDGKWDVIHFNWGLHDLKHVAGKRATPIEKYAANLDALVKRMRKTGAKLIFATTTPVPKGSNGRVAGDAKVYNAVAIKVMKAYDIPINDLHAFSLPKLKTLQRPANVHFLPAGSKALAAQVAASIMQILDGGAKPTIKGAKTEVKWTPLTKLTDEFNGKKLDDAKWHDHNPK